MRFDTSNTGKYFFDDRQTLTKEEWDNFEEDYRTEYHEYVKKTASSFIKKDANRPSYMKPVLYVPVGIGLLLFLIGAVMGSVILAIGGFALVFVYAGIFTMITGGVSKDAPNPSADTASNRFTGLIIALLPVVPILMWFVFLKDKPTAYKVFIVIGCVMIGIGILALSRIIFHKTAKNRVYPEEVNATCIGYARYAESSSDNDGMSATMIPKISPVFEYSYEGERYTCVYDGFSGKKDSDVKLGPVTINISPKYPEGIYNKEAEDISALVIMVIAGFVIGACLLAIAISGAYTQWKPSTNTDNVVRIVDFLDRN